MLSDLSKQLQIKVMERISYTEKLDLNDKEAREILIFNPDFAILYLKTKFSGYYRKSKKKP